MRVPVYVWIVAVFVMVAAGLAGGVVWSNVAAKTRAEAERAAVELATAQAAKARADAAEAERVAKAASLQKLRDDVEKDKKRLAEVNEEKKWAEANARAFAEMTKEEGQAAVDAIKAWKAGGIDGMTDSQIVALARVPTGRKRLRDGLATAKPDRADVVRRELAKYRD